MLRHVSLAVLAAVTLAACDATSGGSQNLFEDQAYLTAPGSVSGWPVGPAFDARISVLQPPTPNPAASGESVSMLLDVTVAAPGGFALYRLNREGGRDELELVDALDGVGSPWFYTFSFFAREVDALSRPGTYRLLVLDGNRRVVTYGDFTLTP